MASSGDTGAGAVIGIVVGLLALVVACGAIWYWRKRAKEAEAPVPPPPDVLAGSSKSRPSLMKKMSTYSRFDAGDVSAISSTGGSSSAGGGKRCTVVGVQMNEHAVPKAPPLHEVEERATSGFV